jgi:hypothetical protein
MLYKTTTKLFRGKYQYKVVIISSGCQFFRSRDMADTLRHLKSVKLDNSDKRSWIYQPTFKSQEDLDYAFKLQSVLAKISDMNIRVESPWISVYTNDKTYVNEIINLDESKIKYVSLPSNTQALTQNTIIMPKMDYDYRVTLAKIVGDQSAFLSWAESNNKIKLTKSCKKELGLPRSWGGKHFYVQGDNNLLVTKMHLGQGIAKIERIVKE